MYQCGGFPSQVCELASFVALWQDMVTPRAGAGRRLPMSLCGRS